MLHKTTFIVLVMHLLLTDAIAQQEKGDTQMSLSASFRSNTSSGSSTSSFNFQYSYSKFFTKHFELGLSYSGSFSDKFSFSGISPFASFNILSKNGRFVFYLGAQYLINSSTIDTGSGKSTTTSGGVGAKAGIRSYLNDNVFIFIGPNYSAFANSQSQFDMTAGIGVLFKKTKKAQ